MNSKRVSALFVAVGLLCPTLSSAQSEAEILKFAEEGMNLVKSGQLKPLDYYKEVFRRIQITPASTYPFKAENLRIIGERVDIYEDAEAGKISLEKANRLVAQQQANWDEDGAKREQADREQREREAREAAYRRQMLEAQAESERRAMGLQLLQQMNRQTPYQLPQPYQMQPLQQQRQTNCTSQMIGNQWVTNCR